jgi:hypothetical protein
MVGEKEALRQKIESVIKHYETLLEQSDKSYSVALTNLLIEFRCCWKWRIGSFL